MKKIKLKPAFEDDRGTITDILDHEPIDAVTMITFTKGAVRANHYHKETVQWNYLISGELLYRSRDKKSKISNTTMKPGDFAVSAAGEVHAMKGLKKSLLLVLTRGPRGGADYESDTFRDNAELIKARSAKRKAKN